MTEQTKAVDQAMRRAVEERDRKIEAAILGFILRGYSMRKIRVRNLPSRFEDGRFILAADVLTLGEPMNARKS